MRFSMLNFSFPSSICGWLWCVRVPAFRCQTGASESILFGVPRSASASDMYVFAVRLCSLGGRDTISTSMLSANQSGQGAPFRWVESTHWFRLVYICFACLCLCLCLCLCQCVCSLVCVVVCALRMCTHG